MNPSENSKVATPSFPSVEAPSSALQQTIRLLARLGRERFFGKLTLSFEAGNIVTLRKEETLKPTDLAR